MINNNNNNHNLNDEILKVIEIAGITEKPKKLRDKLEFKDLMKFRVDSILMVCSLYDYYTIVEDGHLQEAIFNEFLELNLTFAPHIVRTNSGESALEIISKDKFDLIIITLRIGEMSPEDFTQKAKKLNPDVPIVLLVSQSTELQLLLESGRLRYLDKIYIWTGDRKIFLAMIKIYEDLKNSQVDCLEYGVTSILLVEDSPTFYSSYLPLIYKEVMNQSQKLIDESKNSAEKLLRQRARPKIFHATTFDQAIEIIKKFKESLLGIITDLKFDFNGKIDENAGFHLIKEARKIIPHIPMVLQTAEVDRKNLAEMNEVAFLDKNSRTLLLELSEFMKSNFGFGDFIFRMPDGTEVYRAHNLKDLKERMNYIPDESLLYHSKRNHFSYWLIARTEFELAYKLRPVHISQFENVTRLREYLVKSLANHMTSEQRGVISTFTRSEYEAERVFQMIGEGSLGGKARGLGFIDKLLQNYIDPNYFPNIEIAIPRTIVIGTEVFAKFMEMNNLYRLAVRNIPDDRILREFLKADLPATVIGDIGEILKKAKFPLAIRSSSLLEDAMYQPFAGIYATVMIPNSNPSSEVRFHNLVQAIKFVYASTYMRSAKNYIEATGNRIEEEKMAVIIQEMVGRKFGHYFYPSFSGVARSYNYYPFAKATPKDGIVNIALGLGKTIVDGGVSLQFCPEYPTIFPQFGNTKDLFSKSQTQFWALDLNSDIIRREPNEDMYLVKLNLRDAENHGSLKYIASTYSNENDVLYEGISRSGPRVLNFAPILKSRVIPLNQILKLLLRMCEVAMNCPVEIEFAALLGDKEPHPVDFRFLQVRPMVKPEGAAVVDFDVIPNDKIVIKSNMALGNGKYELDTVLFVKQDSFNVSKTKQIAEEINELNAKLRNEKRHYLLIGPGRWGSSDPWLGIPCDFSYLNAAQVIVESSMPHMVVDPSQGSHFFQNMTSFKIAYITVREQRDDEKIDWEWLNNQHVEQETQYLKLVNLNTPLQILVDGQSGKGAVLKS
jgi:hypothetical protein